MLTASYFILSAYVIGFLYIAMNKSLVSSNVSAEIKNRYRLITILSGVAWLTYVGALIQTEILKDLSLPPKFPLLILVPIIVFLIGFYIKHKDSTVIKNIPAKWLVYFQSFRVLVEIVLYYTFLESVIPKSATFEGNNFDIVMGVLAPIVALTLYRNLSKYRKLAVAWNVLGILMILIVAVTIGTSMYAPELWGSSVPLVSEEFVELPYFLIAAVIAPGAIFVHVISLIQLRQLKN